MYLNTDYIEPSELTGYVRSALADLAVNQFTLSRFLPDTVRDDIDYRFTRGGQGLIQAATFRNYDTPSRFGKRPGAVRVSGSLPPISRQLRLGEYDRLKLRNASDDGIVNAIYDDADNLVRSIAARMELARGEVLVTGKVAISEGGVVATADYGRASGHTVTAGTPWSSLTTATPLTNLIAWADTFEATNGTRPEVLLTSRQGQRLMTRNKEIIDAIKGSTTGNTRVSLAELNDLLVSEGIPEVQTYDPQVLVGATATRPIQADKLLLLGPGQLGETMWGSTVESRKADYGLEDSQYPGIVAGVYETDAPSALYTNAVAIGLPMLGNPDLSFAADIF